MTSCRTCSTNYEAEGLGCPRCGQADPKRDDELNTPRWLAQWAIQEIGVQFAPLLEALDEKDRLARYCYLLERGLSAHEARESVWPPITVTTQHLITCRNCGTEWDANRGHGCRKCGQA